jgi:phage baseplate assembly protein W
MQNPFITTNSQFKRDPAIVGNDIYMSPQEDLAVNNGDLYLITNVDSIQSTLLRRIYTSRLDYERVLRTPEGLYVADSDYGNNSFQYLSALNNPINQNNIINEITRIFDTENRVSLNRIDFQEAENNEVKIIVEYIILSNNELAILTLN